MRATWPLLYLGSVILINALFLLVPPFHTPWGMASLGAFGIGGVYIARDCVQRVHGPKLALILMGLGIAITAIMSPKLALASGSAFAVGEGIEFIIFSSTGRPFRERVAWSAPPGVLADTAVFLLIAGFFSWPNFFFESLSKALALAWIFWLRDPLQK
jgi:uncharacterized PurR-regulated membrane protein YhhQ (DUF165 family)